MKYIIHKIDNLYKYNIKLFNIIYKNIKIYKFSYIMKNQIIKKYIDFFDLFIKENCIQEYNYYLLNNIVYNKIVYNNNLESFLIKLKDYYYPNKYHYLNKTPFTYKSFTTIIRQIIHNNDIKYVKKIKYNLSKYTTEYFLYI